MKLTAAVIALSSAPRRVPSVARPLGDLSRQRIFQLPSKPAAARLTAPVRHSEYSRSTCQRIIRANFRRTSSFPLTRPERAWQSVSDAAVIAATCQAGRRRGLRPSATSHASPDGAKAKAPKGEHLFKIAQAKAYLWSKFLTSELLFVVSHAEQHLVGW